MTFRATFLCLALTLVACSASFDDASNAEGGADASSGSEGMGEEVSGEPTACGEAEVVTFTTADGVTLEADYVPSGEAGGTAAVLLHMIPPGNDRTNFPPEFVSALGDAGYTVLNVDRRGAGGSEGEPTEAYEGPNGKEDALAAVAFLEQSGCAVAPEEVVIIGASNGTTTTFDYTVAATVSPKALVLLSPGGYTENQNAFADQTERLAALPVFLGYPDNERGWPDGVRDQAGEAWVFMQYGGGGHGTRLFETNPEVISDIVSFLDAT